MTGEGADELDRDTRLAASAEEIAAAHADAVQRDLHTCLPGIIKDFNPSKQTATVQPAIKRTFYGEEAVDLPLCLDVPVVFPAGGPLVLTFPITDGDECLLFFAERAIDSWWDRGGTQLPSEYRLHDLSDGFALVGISSKPRMMTPPVATDAVELRTRDGSLVFSMTPTLISLGEKNVQPAVVGTDTKQKLHDLIQALVAHTHGTGMGPSGPPINASDMSAVDAALDEILSTSVVVQKSP
jgi:hypothetical protein